MFQFIIDIFCKDTVIGLSDLMKINKGENSFSIDSRFSGKFNSEENTKKSSFNSNQIRKYNLNIDSMFIGPCVYHL